MNIIDKEFEHLKEIDKNKIEQTLWIISIKHTTRFNPGAYVTPEARIRSCSFIMPQLEVAPRFFKVCWTSVLLSTILIVINEHLSLGPQRMVLSDPPEFC
jgi:hypothetical protein